MQAGATPISYGVVLRFGTTVSSEVLKSKWFTGPEGHFDDLLSSDAAATAIGQRTIARDESYVCTRYIDRAAEMIRMTSLSTTSCVGNGLRILT